LIALQALASTIDDEELSDLKDQFAAIDVDKNGAISLEEMRQVKVLLHIQPGLHYGIISLSSGPNMDGFLCRPLLKIYLGS
jgi:hypothetical protein